MSSKRQCLNHMSTRNSPDQRGDVAVIARLDEARVAFEGALTEVIGLSSEPVARADVLPSRTTTCGALAAVAAEALQGYHERASFPCAREFRRHRRRSRRDCAICGPNAATVATGSLRSCRRESVPQAGNPATHRFVQIPRRLQQAVVDSARCPQGRRGGVFVRQSCARCRGGRQDPQHARHHRDAGQFAAVEARAHQILRRRGRVVRS